MKQQDTAASAPRHVNDRAGPDRLFATRGRSSSKTSSSSMRSAWLLGILALHAALPGARCCHDAARRLVAALTHCQVGGAELSSQQARERRMGGQACPPPSLSCNTGVRRRITGAERTTPSAFSLMQHLFEAAHHWGREDRRPMSPACHALRLSRWLVCSQRVGSAAGQRHTTAERSSRACPSGPCSLDLYIEGLASCLAPASLDRSPQSASSPLPPHTHQSLSLQSRWVYLLSTLRIFQRTQRSFASSPLPSVRLAFLPSLRSSLMQSHTVKGANPLICALPSLSTILLQQR